MLNDHLGPFKCLYISSRSSRGRMDKVPRGIGVSDAGMRELVAGSRGRGGFHAWPLSWLGMTEGIGTIFQYGKRSVR